MPTPSITLSAVSWSTPQGNPVLAHLDVAFAAERTGLVGRNGCGKTTLLRLITGELTVTSGSIARSGTIASLRQIVARREAETLAEALALADQLATLRRIERGYGTEDDLLQADWTLEPRLEAAFSAAGLDADTDAPVASLSGGQQTRAGLAAAILADPDFLLLDEPTNNLDAEGHAALSSFLATWRKGAIVAGHDRALLEGMDAIVELGGSGATRYGGPYSHYAARKALEIAAARQAVDVAGRKLDTVRTEVQRTRERQDRRDGAGQRKARKGDMPRILLGARRQQAEATTGANSRIAARLEADAAASLADARASLEVIEPLRLTLSSSGLAPSRTVLEIANVTAGYDSAWPILQGIDLAIVGPERVALTGRNGAGKSTLLRLIQGSLAPWSGTVQPLVPFALLDQHASLLDPTSTVVANFRRLKPELDENAARAALARFRFRGSAADQLAGTLSGGQAMRAALACVLAGTPPPLLLLDEPTNHLDLDAMSALEAGLAVYDGALLVVSHDQAFLSAIGITRTVTLSAGA